MVYSIPDMIDQATKYNLVLVEHNTTAHCIDNRLGLFKDFLLHERIKLTLHDLMQLEIDPIDCSGAIVGLVLFLATMKSQTSVPFCGLFPVYLFCDFDTVHL